MRNDSHSVTLYLSSLFCLMMSATFAVCIAFFRLPFSFPVLFPILKCLLLFAAIVFTWQELVSMTLRSKSKDYSLPLTATIIVLFLPCLVLDSTYLHWILLLLLAAISLVGFARMVQNIATHPIELCLIVLVSFLLGVGYFVWVNSPSASHILSPEYALIGRLNRDTLLHAAIASMGAQQGIVSTGLDGLVPIKYHFLSHLWIGLTARWLEVPTVHAYYLVPQIVGMPLFFFAIITASQDHLGRSNLYLPPVIMLLIPIALLILFDAGNWASYLNSESHLLGLILFLLSLPLLVQVTAKGGSWLSFVIIGILGTLMLFAKISIGAIWFVGTSYSIYWQQRARRPLILGVSAGVACLLLLWSLSAIFDDEILVEDPLFFIRRWPVVFSINVIAICTLWLVAGLIYRQSDVRQRIVIGLFVVMSLVSLVPAFILGSDARSSVFYFIDVGAKLAIVFIAQVLASQSIVGGIRFIPYTILILSVVVWSITPAKTRSWSDLARLAGQLEADVRGIGQDSIARVQSIGDVVSSLKNTADGIDRTPGAQLVDLLSQKVGYGASAVLVFVPPSNREFWSLNAFCGAQPHFIPALLAVPMLSGVAPACPAILDRNYGYGYSAYGADAISTERSDPELCAKAGELGYSNVFVLRSNRETKMLDCTSSEDMSDR